MTPFTKEQNPNEKSFLAKTVDTAVHTTKMAVVVPAMVVAQIMESYEEAQESTGDPSAVATAKARFHM